MDAEQLLAVQNFKNKLQNKNGLYENSCDSCITFVLLTLLFLESIVIRYFHL